MRVGIITIGNELLSGFTLDRNAAWIGQQLLSAGIKVNVHHTIPDDFGAIYDTLEYQLKEWRCDQILTPHHSRLLCSPVPGRRKWGDIIDQCGPPAVSSCAAALSLG